MERNQIYFRESKEWHSWLKNNHSIETIVWLVFYKKDTGKPTMDYESAVEEALCFGWIDSIVKKIDSERFVRKFTPRKDNSNWSESNKKRVARLIRTNRMQKSGIEKVDFAKRHGRWDKVEKQELTIQSLPEFQIALNLNKKANSVFEKLSPSHKRQYIGWISAAKRQETKNKRVKEAITLLENDKKLGLK